MNIRNLLILSILSFSIFSFSQAKTEKSGDDEFNPGEVILHHVLDSHDWEITEYPSTDENGHKVYKWFKISLPWLFYSSKNGFEFFLNTHGMEEDGKYYVCHDDHKLYHVGEGPKETEIEDTHSAEKTHDDHPSATKGHTDGHHHSCGSGGHATITDLSPTKTVVQIMIVLTMLFFVFRSVAKGFVRNKGKAPSGAQSFFEPIIEFVRDDIGKSYLGDKHERFMPYLLSIFFFIWFSNLFGLTPFNSNIMGNISITLALAIITFVITQVVGTKDYWIHIFAMPGVPKPLLALLTPLEIFGMFTKPFALAIRLFANISGGHFMVLSLISLIFILGESGKNIGGVIGALPISVGLTLGIFCLEMLVAILQAYIFTLLSAVFIGAALESHDHEEAHH